MLDMIHYRHYEARLHRYSLCGKLIRDDYEGISDERLEVTCRVCITLKEKQQE